MASVDFMPLFQNIIPVVIPSQNVMWTLARLSTDTDPRAEIKDDLHDTKHYYRSTSSPTGHPIFLSIRDWVTEWAGHWHTDQSWWSAELATAVTGPHSPNYFKNMVHESKENRREELLRIFNAEWRVTDSHVVLKIQNIFLNVKFPKNQTYVHIIFLTGNYLRNKLWTAGQCLPDCTAQNRRRVTFTIIFADERPIWQILRE
jgi:hypothetical protein